MLYRHAVTRPAPRHSLWSGLLVVALAISIRAAYAEDKSAASLPEAAPTAPVTTPATTAPDAEKPAPETANEPIAAKIDGKPIYQREVEQALGAARQKNLDPQLLANVQASLLEQMITARLLEKYLADQKSTASETEIDAAMERLKSNLKQQHSDFSSFLTRMHATEAEFRESIGRELSWRKFAALNDSDDNLRGLFKQLHEQFDGTTRRVSHILLRPEGTTDPAALSALRDRAIKLRDDITAGHISFEAAAEKYSAGPSRHQGGDLGYIPPQGVMAADFSQTAFALQPGEISQPVVTNFGIHLIKVTDIKPGTKSFGEVRDVVKAKFADYLYRQVISRLRQMYADKIEYDENYPHFKPGTTELANPTTPTATAVGP